MRDSLEYRVEEKRAFSVVGMKHHFSTKTCYVEIPLFWSRTMDLSDHPVGVFGLCYNSTDGEFDYMIGDLYAPWKAVPEGWEAYSLEKQKWVVFPITGKIPDALQAINTRIWSEWLSQHNEFTVSGNYSIELYAPPAENPEECYSEIWIPVS